MPRRHAYLDGLLVLGGEPLAQFGHGRRVAVGHLLT